MKQKSTFLLWGVMVALLLTVFTSSWALRGVSEEEGTSTNPIVIADSADWVMFATNVNAGVNADKYYRLDADINVTMMVGTSEHKFSGFFNGNGHTLNVNLSSTSKMCAPFRFVENATISMLHITGVLTAGSSTSNEMNMCRSGLIGSGYGTVNIINCWSSVTINSELNGDGTHGGFVGIAENGRMNIINSLFDGKLLGSNTNSWGGFVGWRRAEISIVNSVFAPAEVTVNTANCATFSRNGVTPVNSYYTQALGDAQGTAIGEMTNEQLLDTLGASWQIVNEKLVPNMNGKTMSSALVSGIKHYYLYTGEPIDIDYTITAADGKTLVKDVDYTVITTPNDTVKEAADYTMVFKGMGEYTDSIVRTFIVGEGIEVTSSTTNLEDNMIYKVKNNVTVNNRISISGSVMLILGENATLNATKGIEVGSERTLTIDGTGTLNATGGSDNAGIGGYEVGTIIINGGTINAKGGSSGAGIGGSLHNINGGTIIINGGVVNATGGYEGAGIGGGRDNWAGNYGRCGNITINGGQVTAIGGTYASGFGPGYNADYKSGNIVIGWTDAENDFVYASSISNKTNSIAFAEDKKFFNVDSRTVASVKDIAGKKLVPFTTEAELRYATFFDFKKSIAKTGSIIDSVEYVLKDVYGKVLIKDSDFVETISPDTIKEVGDYTLTITGKGFYTGTITETFRVVEVLEGNGTAEEPYTIATTDDWNKFAESVAKGYSYKGETVKLTADINISTMVGVRDSFPFSGTFDGAGHTITADIVSTESTTDKNVQGVAPFHYIYSATIKNLTVAGSISSNSYHTAGIVGFIGGPNAEVGRNIIDSCVVTATLIIGSDYAGGIVGHGMADDNVNTRTDISNTVFAGTIQSNNTSKRSNVGGIWGWGTTNVVIKNCLENGKYTNINSFNPRGLCGSNNGSATSFYYMNNDVNSPSNNSTVDDARGCHKVFSAPQDDNIYLPINIMGYDFYQNATVNGMKEAYEYNNGNPINLGYTLKLGANNITENIDYTTVIRDTAGVEVLPENVKIPGTSFTITFAAKEGNEAGFLGSTTRSFTILPAVVILYAYENNSNVIAAHNGLLSNVHLYGCDIAKNYEWHTICLPFNVELASSPLAGAKVKTLTDVKMLGKNVYLTLGKDVDTLKAGTPYAIMWDEPADLVINSADDWNAFAEAVAGGNSFEGKTVRLNSDITISTMVGTAQNMFMGYFAGEGHTITLDSLSATTEFCAPFRYVKDATINSVHTKGVVVAGTHTSNDKYRSGLVGCTNGNTTISNCWSSVVIDSKIDGDGTHGGLVGVANDNTQLVDCRFDGTITGETTYSCGGLIGWNNSKTKLTNCLFMPDSISLKDQSNATFGRNTGNVTTVNCYYSEKLGDVQGTAIDTLTVAQLAEKLGDEWLIKGGKVVPVMKRYTANVSDLTFNNVVVDSTINTISMLDGQVKFVANYDTFTVVDSSDVDIFTVVDGPVMQHATDDTTINAFTPYFQFTGKARLANIIEINFGGGVVTSVENNHNSHFTSNLSPLTSQFYTLEGVKLNGKPTKRGLYIRQGSKFLTPHLY